MEGILEELKIYLRNEETVVESWISHYSLWPQSHVLLAIDVEKIRSFVVKLRTINVTAINHRFTADIIHNAGFRAKFLQGSASRVHFVALLSAFVIRHMILHDALQLPSDLLTDIPFAQVIVENMRVEEANFFHRFHIALYYCDKIVRAKRNKGLFLKTCGLVEGSGRLYITGGGNRPSAYTRCRVELFIFRTGVKPIHKPQKLASTSSENNLTAPDSDTDHFLDAFENLRDFSHSDDEDGDLNTATDPTNNDVGVLTVPTNSQIPCDPVDFCLASYVLPPPTSSFSSTHPIFSIPSENIEYFEMTKDLQR